MQERELCFHGDLGRLAGVLRLPDTFEPPLPCVVLCAGMSLTKEVWLPEHAERLVAAGYATLNFDYSTFGGSDGQPRCRLNCQQQVRDVQSALSFVSDLPEIDEGRLGLYGVSLGASVAAATAGRDRRVGAAVAVAGPMDLARVWRGFPGFSGFSAKVDAARRTFTATGEASYIDVPRLLASDPETAELLRAEDSKYPTWRQEVTFESLADLFLFRPEDELPRARAAILFVYPEHDALIARFEMQSAYARAGGPAELLALKGAQHVDVYRREGAFQRVLDAASGWFAQHL